ncbi:MAG: hypothetical protein WCX73_03595 [Candidatus Pacearchaeota archaeon]|jgi:hypothetical protein
MVADKWYNSEIARYVGIGIMCLGIGLGIKSCTPDMDSSYDIEKARTERIIEPKRLELIEKIVEKYADSLDANGLSNFLKDNHLND